MAPADQPGKPRRKVPYAEQLARGDTYGLVLILLLATYMLIALPAPSLWARFVDSLMLGAVLLLTLHTSHVRARAFRVFSVLVVLAVASTFVQALLDHQGNDGSTFIIYVLLLVAPVVILNRILRHRVVTLETILGALCVYVLFAIAFAGLYAMVNNMEQHGFFVQTHDPTGVDFLYFSFVTITTVGFGDLTAATSTGRVLVTFEALFGQIFLVTLVARLVSLYGIPRQPADDTSGVEE